MGFLLNFAYLFFLLLAWPVVLYRVLVLGKYRHGLCSKFFGRGDVPVMPPVDRTVPDAKRLWFHAVSVGEMNLLKPIVKRIREEHPSWQIVISSTSKTGYELGKTVFGEYPVFYCPLDFTWAVGAALRRVKPDWLVLVELELWPNLIMQAKKHGVRVAIVNGRISEKSFRRYRYIRFLTRALLNVTDVVAAQDELAADCFTKLGARHVVTTGAIKFDGAQTDRANEKTVALARLAGLGDEPVFLAGSTQDPEERYALDAWRSLVAQWPTLRLIIVPRHPERFDAVAKMLESSQVAWRRRSTLTEPEDHPAPVLLVDTIGELGAWWGTARIAFVGGSFGTRGGQNMLEPGAYGAAVCFGPNTKNFRDISARMLREDAARVVATPEELTAFVRQCLEDDAWCRRLGENAARLVASQKGATARTIELLARPTETR